MKSTENGQDCWKELASDINFLILCNYGLIRAVEGVRHQQIDDHLLTERALFYAYTVHIQEYFIQL